MFYPAVLLVLLVPALAGAASPRFPAPEGTEAVAHSHNDFAQSKPLDLALAQKYRSVEVDVIERWNEVRVTHLGILTDGSLREMYLDRLQKIVDRQGSVHGDGKRFYLWIEVRSLFSGDRLAERLRELLDRYSMFAKFDESGAEVQAGPVEAILINSPGVVARFFEGRRVAPACRGMSGIPQPGETLPTFTRWAYMRWKNAFSWMGRGPIPATDLVKLRTLQGWAHERKLRTRYWEAPDTEDFWKTAARLPFDLVNTDRLAATMHALRSVRGRRPASWRELR